MAAAAFVAVHVALRAAVASDPYEERIVAIERDWMNALGGQVIAQRRIVIETPAGSRIVRTVNDDTLIRNRFELGDYVVKAPGWFSSPRVPGRRTVRETNEAISEVLQEAKSAAER
jgi:hypothetical protein